MLRRWYGERLPRGGRVLDFMSSWRSHLPAEGLGAVTALGMNAAEMRDNPAITGGILVHDVNRQPATPFADAAFDGAVCSVSVQYLVRPIETLVEVRRTLGQGAPLLVSFSNRCFPTKAVAAWLYGTDRDHLDLVMRYLTQAGYSGVEGRRLESPDDPLWVVSGTA